MHANAVVKSPISGCKIGSQRKASAAQYRRSKRGNPVVWSKRCPKSAGVW